MTILLPDLRGGGVERVSVNLANSFVQLGYAVDVALLSAAGESLTDLLHGIRVVDLKVKRLRGVLFPLARYVHLRKAAVLLACIWPLTVIAIWSRILSCQPMRVAKHTTWSQAKLPERRGGA